MDGQTSWIQCCKSPCGKWRIVREEVAKKYENLPWSCEMNENRHYGKCSAPEQEIAVPSGEKVVLIKFPFKNGEIIMAKLSGYCSWPALISPDPYCNLYYDAVLNEKDEEDEITHIHVEFFGWPKSHAWVSPNNISPFSAEITKLKSTKVKSRKTNKSYQLAIEEASKAMPFSCEERLRNCTFKTIDDLSKRESQNDVSLRRTHRPKRRQCQGSRSLKREISTTKKDVSSNEKDFFDGYEKFMAEKGFAARVKPPVWNGKAINLYKIFQSVQNCGGYNQVSRKRQWFTLRGALLNNDNPFAKPSGNLKLFYERYMLDFEEHLNITAGKEVKRKKLNESKTFSAKSNTPPDGAKLPASPIISTRNENYINDLNQSTDLISTGSHSGPSSLRQHEDDIECSNNTLLLDKHLSIKSQNISTNLIPAQCSTYYDRTETNITAPLVTHPSSVEEAVDMRLDGYFDAGVDNVQCDTPTICQKYVTSTMEDDFVASSNPASPQILPKEEDLEEDCGTSIKRELEEMERILDLNLDSANEGALNIKDLSVWERFSCRPSDERARSVKPPKANTSLYRPNKQGKLVEITKVAQNQDQLTNNNSWLLKDNEVKDAIREILEIEEHISQLENSTELDSL